MKRFLARAVAVLIGAVSVSQSLNGLTAAQERLLSASDKGYGFLEQLQGTYCNRRPSHNCNHDLETCQTRIRSLWQQLFAETPPDRQMAEMCLQVSTKYELPGFYDLLKDILSNVESAREAVGLSKVDNVRFGSLAIREVNARVLPPDPTFGNLVVFNIRFFEFASELAKVAARTIPMTVDGDQIKIDGSQAALDENLRNDPEARFLFVNRLMAFLEVEGLKPATPSTNIQNMLRRYQEGIETFAMAHEYAHLALGHTGAPRLLDGVDVDASALGISGQSADWAQELEADYYAAMLVRQFARNQINRVDRHLTDYMLPLTPQFYFAARDIVQRADSIVIRDSTPQRPSEVERALLSRALECVKQPNCNLAALLRKDGDLPKGHPHPAIRRDFVGSLLAEKPGSDDQAAMHELASQMLRNIDYLWIEVERLLLSPQGKEIAIQAREARARRLGVTK